MSQRKEWLAMLLAGGQGSRLYVLTQKIAKPAVPYGGKYRIIDFPLSNCVNSGIDTVGVLTQYQPLLLNDYIGNGQPWDLDRSEGGVHVLPPYQGFNGADWYKGTANAVFQNLNFMDRYNPAYVLILSGDHIYKMNYRLMLDFHKKNGADCTIAAIRVPMEEAPRFGIINAHEDGEIYEFEEKPKQPKSDLASMGVYIFTWSMLKKYLTEDNANPESDNDFGKNIIPAMLKDGRRLYAYAFEDYWKDVGTIASLWEAHMDLLKQPPEFNLNDHRWPIYARTPVMPPHYVGPEAKVNNCLITEGCEIYGEARGSVLFAGVTIEKGALVEDSVIMPGCRVRAGAVIRRAIVAEQSVISRDCVVGASEGGIARIGQQTTLPEG